MKFWTQKCHERHAKQAGILKLIWKLNKDLHSKYTQFFYWIQDGKEENELVLVEDILSKLSRDRYTLAELQERPLPEGVDPSKLESYLSDEEFQVSFVSFSLST